MPDDKGGSDLDVFEGLGKKAPAADSGAGPARTPDPSPTIRGGFSNSAQGLQKPLPMPSKPAAKSTPAAQGVALPKPTPPPSKSPSAPGAAGPSGKAVALPKPKPPPSKGAAADAPEVVVGADLKGFYHDAESPGSILPGGVAADLDWDDEQESTAVFDRQEHDLFDELAPRSRVEDDDVARRQVASAAALLKQSGGQAAPVSFPPPASAPIPVSYGMPIPGPAPIPQPEPARAVAPGMDAGRVSGYTPSLAPGIPGLAPSRAPWILAIVAFVAVVVAGAIYFLGNRTGAVAFTVTRGGKMTDRAQIYVDGQRRCDFTPCVLEGLTPGTKSIRATDGTKVALKQIDVQAGQKLDLTIALDEGEPAGPATPEPGALATLKIGSDQKGVKLFVDGVEKGTLPVELKDLQPGTAKLRFNGGDAWAASERTVELKAGETVDLGMVNLAPLKVKVTFRLETAGAKAKLFAEGDGGKREELKLDFARSKEVVQTLDTAKRWTVEATKKGFDDLKKELSFADGKPEQVFPIELVEEGKAAPVAAATATPPATTPAATATAAPATGGGMGTLSVNSVPPSKALVDGRPVGNTPTSVQVPAGSHTVVFVHKDLGRKSVTVTVNGGETKVAAVRFKKPEGE